MKAFKQLLAIVILAALAFSGDGCASPRRAATARVTIASGTNSVEITQPKDTTIKRLEWDPRTGKLVMEEYASAANAAVVAGETEKVKAQAATFDRAIAFGQSMGTLAARAYGVPTGDLQGGLVQTSPSTVWTIPDPPQGMKWVLGTNGVPKLSPKDDPSEPKPETPTPKP